MIFRIPDPPSVQIRMDLRITKVSVFNQMFLSATAIKHAEEENNFEHRPLKVAKTITLLANILEFWS